MNSKKEKEENPNAFKHWINRALLQRMGEALRAADPSFDQKEFLRLAPKLEPLELKPRVRLVRDELRRLLPDDYPRALKILLKSLREEKLSGFDLWPYTEFVQAFGLEHVDLSLDAMKELTKRFTSEFAVRPFLKIAPDATLAFLQTCTKDPDKHVRRWASEGSRPRLPWGERLDAFVKDPSPVIPILEELKNDPELYVRKSVANHLNDIGKDNPEVLLRVLQRWNKETDSENRPRIDWITKHALRSLIKAGNPKALKLIGVAGAEHIKLKNLKLNKRSYSLDERIEFECALVSTAKKPQKIVVDYVIHYVKSNGKTAPKVFKLSSQILGPGETWLVRKKHHLKPVTTRRHYQGRHRLEIQVNGHRLGSFEWDLKVASSRTK